MAAVQQQVDKQALKSLVPLNGLSRPHFDELVGKSETKDVAAGRYLFREGERDGITYFLLSGEIALMQGREVKETIKAGTEAARHPIAHQQPRQLSAKAQGRITVLAVDSGLLDVMLAWDQTNSYEVTEIQSEDDEDWMTRMLQSELFQRLPASNIQQVLMRVEEFPVTAGQVVVRQDEEGDYYYMIKQGRAEVTRRPAADAKPVRIAELQHGDSFGEESLLSGARRNATVTMLTDGVLMRLSKADFDALLREPMIHQVDFEQARKLVADGAAWLDVRLPGEYQNAHLPDSLNIPLASVRDSVAELQGGRPYVVCCDTGTRSTGAAFLLNQRGFDTFVLAGGLNSVPREALQRSAREESSAEVIAFQGRDSQAPAERKGEADVEAARAKAAAFLKQARQQAEAMRAKLRAVQQQIAEKEAKARELDGALRDKEKELRELHRSFERAEAMGEELERLRGALEKAQDQVARQQREFEQARQAGAEREQEMTLLREQADELAQAQQTLARLERERDELDAARAREAEARAELERQIEAQGQNGDSLARELNDARARVEELQGRVQALESERADAQALAQRLQALQGERDDLERRLGESRQEAEAERSALEEQLRAQSAELEALQRSLAERDARDEDAGARLQEIERQAEAYRERSEAAAAELAEARARAGELEQRVQTLEAEREATADELRQRLDESERSCAALQEALEAARSEAEQNGAERHTLAQERDALREQHDRAQAELQRLQEQSASLERALSEVRGEAEALQHRVQELESEHAAGADALRQQLEEAQRARTELQQALNAAAAEAAQRETDLQARLEAAQSERRAAGEQRDALQGELDQMREALQQRLAEVERLQGDSAKLGELERQLTEARQQLDAARAEQEGVVERLRGEHEAALGAERQRVEHLREELDTAQAAADRERREREEVQSRLESLQRELDAGEREVDERIAALQGELDGLRGELSEARGRGDEAERQLHREQERLQEVEAARAALTAELERTRAEHEQALEEARGVGIQAQSRVAELEGSLEEQRSAAQAAAQEAEDLRRRIESVSAEVEGQRQAREAAEARVAELEAAGAGLQAVADRAEDSERRAARLEDELAAAREEIEALRAGLAAADGDEARAEIASIRDLADQELRQAAEEMKRLKNLLTQEQQRTRKLEAELAISRQLGGDGAYRADLQQVQRNVDEQLARYKAESEAMLEQVRAENAGLRDELQRIRAGERTVAPEPAPDGRALDEALRAADRSDRLFDLPSAPPRRQGVWAAVALTVLVAAGGVGGWWYLQRSAAEPPAAPQPTAERPGSAEATPGRAPEPEPAPQPAAPQPTATPAPAAAPPEPETAAEPAPMRPGRTYQDFLADGGLGPVMVQLPAERFTMGSPASSPYFDERPPREVAVAAFSIGKYEVTFEEYDRFAEATGRPLPDDGGRGRGRRPVSNVAWDDARAYAEWLSEQTGQHYRLPTEAEWEYAARAGTDTFYWWGNGAAQGRANCFDCGSEWDAVQAGPVGSLAANPLGLHDVAGNVMEWVRDCYRSDYGGAPRDGSAVEGGDCSARVARGGSYRSVQDNVRSAKRARFAPGTRADELGFRLARD